MSYEPKDGDVTIFRNEKSTGKQPQLRGTALWNGQKLKISLWIKSGSKGEFWSGRMEPDDYVKSGELPPSDISGKRPEMREVKPEKHWADAPDEDTDLPF